MVTLSSNLLIPRTLRVESKLVAPLTDKEPVMCVFPIILVFPFTDNVLSILTGELTERFFLISTLSLLIVAIVSPEVINVSVS